MQSETFPPPHPSGKIEAGENANTKIELTQWDSSCLEATVVAAIASVFNMFERQVQSPRAQMAAVVRASRVHRRNERMRIYHRVVEENMWSC